jgi:hypothetical protein
VVSESLRDLISDSEEIEETEKIGELEKLVSILILTFCSSYDLRPKTLGFLLVSSHIYCSHEMSKVRIAANSRYPSSRLTLWTPMAQVHRSSRVIG